MGGDLPGLRQIRMARIDDLTVVEVTAMRFSDLAPVFTLDGKHLAFLSARSFDPVIHAYSFDMSFPGAYRPFLVPLAATTPSPFDAEPGGRPTQPASASDDDEPPTTVVDVEGLEQRLRPFPVQAARYSSLRAVRGGVVWLRRPPVGELGDDRPDLEAEPTRGVLEHFDLSRRRCETVAEAADEVWVSGDGKRLVVQDKDELMVRPATPHPMPGAEESAREYDQFTVDLSRVRADVRPGSEWQQAFDETWRLMRDHYWRPDMGGLDWDAIRERYRPLVGRLGSHSELVDLLWEMQGELGTSHAYVIPPPNQNGVARKPGQLGADLRRDDDGTWRIDRVLPGESSDPRARSPLLAPGAGVRAGD